MASPPPFTKNIMVSKAPWRTIFLNISRCAQNIVKRIVVALVRADASMKHMVLKQWLLSVKLNLHVKTHGFKTMVFIVHIGPLSGVRFNVPLLQQTTLRASKQTNKRTNRQGRQAGRQTNRRTSRQADRKPDRKPGRQVGLLG